MRKLIKKGAVATTMSLMLLAVSCNEDFLVIRPTGTLSQAQLASKNGLEGALISAYAQLNGRAARMASANNWVWGSIRGGDSNKGTDPGDFSDINPIQRYEYQTTQGVIAEAWGGFYEGVARANNVLNLLTMAGTDVTDAEKQRIGAEARFLRAHYYFELRRNFLNVPYVDETVDVGSGIEKVKNDKEIWPMIEADMKHAFDNLPERQGAVGRANKWAAAAYLGKIYLYQNKFAEAKAMFDQVIANGMTSDGKKYALVPRYADIFRATNDNNAESVFAIQAAANTGSVNNANPQFDLNYPYNTGPNGPAGCCGFNQPSFELVNSFRTTANGLPLLDESYRQPANELKTDMGVAADAAFTPDTKPVDPRLDHAVGRRGIPYLDWQDFPGIAWIRNQPNGGPYAPKKFIYYRSDVGSLQDNSSWTPAYTALNVTIIRFADVLLMAAEAEIEAGSLTKAMEYTNMVRARAANPAGFVMKNGAPAANYVISPYPASQFATKESARQAVRFERKLELSDEGHRFYDLVRWGIAAPYLNGYLAYESKYLTTALGGAKFTPNQDEYLPIPQAQIDLLGADILKQNPGF
ncbi:RagB/SusD family nutrient uptake outer membrane protein [Telluribacter sp. SYSU D00476]|uniref:RagB/SusD family nutrient uptake outer membrane protein n=1 Tax=Telluribacter sp. SYSU D00476 TaxID=2811430 RepID=UPI001FF41CF6|nr:RagB/SusD family nutrient uptake outer membrane protein [Telluribacter sp. SYSU D00476]